MAHGVGPSLALAVLGVHGPSELAQLVIEEDVASLCLVPGVGKKTASRLLIELKDKLPEHLRVFAAINKVAVTTSERTVMTEVRDALIGLGYSAEETRSVLTDLEGDDVAVLLREALQRLAVK